jgi:hypothetical protein
VLFSPAARSGGAGERSANADRLRTFGDTLFSGAVGRPDPDTVEVYPAHSGGAPCGAGMNGKPMTTIGFERRNNPLLSLDRDEFVARIRADLPPRPAAMEEVVRYNMGSSE